MLMIDKSKLFSSSFKPRWIILDDKKLHIFKNEQVIPHSGLFRNH